MARVPCRRMVVLIGVLPRLEAMAVGEEVSVYLGNGEEVIHQSSRWRKRL